MNIIVDPREIEKKSMSIIEESLPRLKDMDFKEKEIVKRVIHTTGDLGCIDLVKISPGAIEAGLEAIKRGKSVLTDVNMLKTGLIASRMNSFGVRAHCFISDPEVIDEAKNTGQTRAMVAMRKGAPLAGGGIIAVGNAPTALFEILKMIREGEAFPALVVGTPVGFVGAAESKEALREAGICHITMPGTRGGSTVAAAIINALLLQA
ncbi:MAG: precorrin isomerase [Peptococcaceae bacterium BICA1-7]|nr:MAG: precorrin isomerase [Peptococcaceae bacterium BICA1-7]HBV96757.1 precorrin isomerase [Desulfotomaculum sp.]